MPLAIELPDRFSNKQVQLLGLLDKWKKENVQAGYKVTTQIQALDSQLRDIQRQTARAFDDDYWTKLYDMFYQVQTEVQQLSRRHTIIQSLQYQCMELRNDAIKDAHRRTFDWIFTPSEHPGLAQYSISAFTQWLRSGSGVYWLTGKPGRFSPAVPHSMR
jgi:hypothetical protein